jgi:poly(A) polymerase
MPTAFITDELGPLAALLAGMSGVFVVGGAVRDLALGREPLDVDITVTGDPAPAARQLAQKTGGHLVHLGKGEQTVLRVAAGKRIYDITAAMGNDILTDLARRDFTVNAMAWDLTRNRHIDPHGGMADLKGKQIRVVSDTALSADPLRMLRAFRLAAGLGFTIDPETEARIAAGAERIRQTAGERVQAELLKMFAAPRAHPGLVRMHGTGLLTRIFPELSPLIGCTQNRHHHLDVMDHTLAAFGHLESILGHPEPALPRHPHATRGWLKLAALLHDIGKPATRTRDAQGTVHFYGHGRVGAALASGAARRLRCANRLTRYLETVITHHLRPLSLFLAHQSGRLTRRGVIRFFRACGDRVPDLLTLATADVRAKADPGTDRSAAFAAFAGKLLSEDYPRFASESVRPPLITGRDLIRELSLTPSPVFRRILSAVAEARLSGTIDSRQEALALARRLAEKQVEGRRLKAED